MHQGRRVEFTDERTRLMWMVAAEHQFAGLNYPNSGFGIENPDNVYREGLFSGASTYEIRGRWPAKKPAELHFEMRDSIPGLHGLSNEAGAIIGNLASQTMRSNADGTFVVTIDSQPANGRPNHIQIPAQGTSFLIVRDLLNDWKTERPVPLDIRRTGGPTAAPQKTMPALITRATDILSKFGTFWQSYFSTYVYPASPVNTLQPVRSRPGGRGMSTNGWFDFNDNDAIVITARPLGAQSLGIQVADPWGLAYEYRTRSSSLNTTQARPNPDGTYTFVIAAKDPGVANWVDTDGHTGGLIALRWQAMAGSANPAEALTGVRVVHISDLKSTLPPTTEWLNRSQRTRLDVARAKAWDTRLK